MLLILFLSCSNFDILIFKMIDPQNYTIIGPIGQGAFGHVYKAIDKEQKLVAIKKIKFETEEEGIPSSALREIAILKKIKDHPRITPILGVHYSSINQQLNIVFDYYEQDLKKFILNKQYQPNQQQAKRILWQLLEGVAYLHANNILHRDLKPQNILVDAQRNVRLADFGLARLVLHPQKTITHQVETLWYRAPEILLGQKNYSEAVDVWSLGCIYAELFKRKPFFVGNGYEIEQVFQIMKIRGTPTSQDWKGLDQLPDFKATFPRWQKQNLQDYLPLVSPLGIDLLEKMLSLDPSERISAKEALQHGYFKSD